MDTEICNLLCQKYLT